MNAKKYLLWVVILSGGLFLLPALCVAVFDPFFIYHKPFVHKDIGVGRDDSYMIAGLINTYLADAEGRHDTIILGTSMSHNIPTRAFADERSDIAIKLTLAAGAAGEKDIILKRAISTGKVKRVVWDIYHTYYQESLDDIREQAPLPAFLYDDTIWNDWQYFFNASVVEEALKAALGKTKKRAPLADVFTWDGEEGMEYFNQPENIQKYKAKLEQTEDIPLRAIPEDLQFPNIDTYLLPALRENPDIEFLLYFPPHSYLGYALSGPEGFWRQMAMRLYLLEQTTDLKNVKIYGFDLVDGWGDDIGNYRDLGHYGPAISADMTEKMLVDKNRLSAAAFPAYVKKLVQRVGAYRNDFLGD